MAQSLPEPENRSWRVIQLVKDNLTENEAREMLTKMTLGYAENSLHEYIERFDGPVTIGRPSPYVV